VRDDRPFGERAPPAAMFFYSRDRSGEHPQQHLAGWAGILQAGVYSGYGELYDAARRPGPIHQAACWAHARRKFFVLADIEASARRRAQGGKPLVLSPIALEEVQRIDALFDIERGINGLPAEQRLAARQEAMRHWSPRSKPECATSGASCPGTATSPAPSTTCSSAGVRSHASSTT